MTRGTAYLLDFVSSQLGINPDAWNDYGQRAQTRREHLRELQMIFGFKPFAQEHYQEAVNSLDTLAIQTDKGIILANALIYNLRNQSILLPTINGIEYICAEAVTRSQRHIYGLLTETLTNEQYQKLDQLLDMRENSNISTLAWLRQAPAAPNAKHLLGHIERLKQLETLELPVGIERYIHQNRLLKIAREGVRMTAQHMRDLEPLRRYATLVAVALETKATVIDEIIDLHDRIIGSLFNRAKRSHEQQFQKSGKEINEKVRLYGLIGNALMEAKQTGGDPYAAIESILSWEAFAQSVVEAQTLARPEDFVHHAL